ncbi:hypothetical protein CERZMDRAFT_117100 [Cercospora zeae-maydis SCOH1-5]|uniref:Uncharacterized protein n=1 Tax=Cercospora zeae-maydis SCOH1-5 TaxID=717836 RepID=A0A6A6FKD6_9PEZI|nr:hypothetical protein CERZMDRAFT_117100 [Cercospora zeae-maydis SCOH1-5]
MLHNASWVTRGISSAAPVSRTGLPGRNHRRPAMCGASMRSFSSLILLDSVWRDSDLREDKIFFLAREDVGLTDLEAERTRQARSMKPTAPMNRFTDHAQHCATSHLYTCDQSLQNPQMRYFCVDKSMPSMLFGQADAPDYLRKD